MQSGEVSKLKVSKAMSRRAGLHFVNDDDPGISRKKIGKGFVYETSRGRRVTDAKTLARIKRLAIPPAWRDVWICADGAGHIQATGRDDRDRKQYRYHEAWARVRDENKFDKLIDFGRVLPSVRTKTRRHLADRVLSKRKVLATIVTLLETTLIRVGNEEYAKSNKSFGLTTLQDRHVDVSGGSFRFQFKGKSGKEWRLKVSDRRIARIVKGCQDLPGQHLFQYVDADGAVGKISSVDVNTYLQEIAGPGFSAKDFRTWAGTVLAALALQEFDAVDSEAAAKRNVRKAIESVAARLGNTTAVCRKAYIHPEVLNCYMEGSLVETIEQKLTSELASKLRHLRAEEAAVLALLHSRLKKLKRERAKAAKFADVATALSASLKKGNPR